METKKEIVIKSMSELKQLVRGKKIYATVIIPNDIMYVNITREGMEEMWLTTCLHSETMEMYAFLGYSESVFLGVRERY